MPISRIAIGSPSEFGQADALKVALVEFISMLIFVFAWEGSGMAYNKLTDNGSATPAGLVAASLSHAFALFVVVSVGANISGGHVNPAVTFGAFIGGHITLIRSLLYWIAQLLGSVVACLLLKLATGGMVRVRHINITCNVLNCGRNCVPLLNIAMNRSKMQLMQPQSQSCCGCRDVKVLDVRGSPH